ncbi:glycosyltransferase family 2 protein [Halorussus ruber]|uniref:glycosyltransferase family 2 protein n=1 Tax=Halorussus ruber TaxID=1126238 RepID=UPI00143DE029|nr:glycosyltransferase family 2 protein [Halorussus ruber]
MRPSEKRQLPVICVAAADAELGAVARTLLRASEHGFSAFVVVSDTDDSTIGDLAERLDAYVLELEFSDESLVDTVESVARAFDFPGLVPVDPSDDEVDFARLEARFRETDDFRIEVPTTDGVSAEEDSRGAVEVVAAIPAYNEGDTIGAVVQGVQHHVDEVVVVDDGSSDDTVAVAERAGATVVEHETNRGYGAAMQTLFSEAHDRNAKVLVTLDGDGQHDPDDVPRLVNAARDGDASLVIGSRFHSDGDHHVPLYRRFGLFVINLLTNLSLGRSWVSDTQSGLRAFDERAIASLATDDTLSDNMSASTDVLYHARRHDYEVEEVGATIYYEGDETSTQNPVSHGLSVVGNILQTIEREQPLRFIGLPGFTTALLGFGLGYWAVANYLQTGSFPTGIVLFCIFTTVVGSLLALTGVILHSIKTHVEALPDHTARNET